MEVVDWDLVEHTVWAGKVDVLKDARGEHGGGQLCAQGRQAIVEHTDRAG